MDSLATVFTAIAVLLLLILVAQILKNIFLPNAILPPAILAGAMLLALGSEGLGPTLVQVINLDGFLAPALFPESMVAVWKELPGFLITIVFAGLFLGRTIPSPKDIWRVARPNLIYGYTLGLGQYVVGLLLALLLLKPLFDSNVLSGVLIPIGFQGGHGTVAGLKSTFESFEFPQGYELGLAIATLGLLSAVLAGTIISNLNQPADSPEQESTIDEEGENNTDKKTSMTVQCGALVLAIGLGWITLQALQAIEEQALSEDAFKIATYIPLFPMAMLGGLVVQVLATRFNRGESINQSQVSMITTSSLDLLIAAAIASLSLQPLIDNWQAVLVLFVGGLVFNLLVYFFLARRLFGQDWHLRGLGELGQSMGTTAIGLLLIRRSGKNADTYVRAFSFKQPFYEPIVGGGVVTAIALPLVAQVGAVVTVVIFAVLTLAVLAFGWLTRE